MRIQTLQTELAKIDRRRAKLQQQIHAQATAIYTSLPRKVGLKSVDDLLVALIPFASPVIRKKLQNGSAGPLKASPEVTTPTRDLARKESKRLTDKRGARYSKEKRTAVRQDLRAGKLTAKEISEKHGVSLPSVNNWKKKWGLTKSSKAK